MNLDAARAVADTVLYEGYVLYPYRASAQKNRSRWQFGVVMPADFAVTDPTESAVSQTECLLEYEDDTVVEVLVRFLQVQRRTVQAADPRTGMFADVDALIVEGTPVTGWEEATEQEVAVRARVAELFGAGRCEPLHAEAAEETELVRDRQGDVVGRTIRRRRQLDGTVTVHAEALDGPWRALRLRVRVENRTRLDPVPDRRDDALPAALVAVHVIIGVSSGAFISMLEPPEWARFEVDACLNIGTWPVLAGADNGRDVMLSSPIILYDHPGVAPESPGNLYDSTEIDEILTLRTLALTDDEKREARATDPRAAAIIDRVDTMDAATMGRLHGTIRYLRGVTGEPAMTRTPGNGSAPQSDGVAVDGVAVDGVAVDGVAVDGVEVNGVMVCRGSSVRLRPGARRADAQDMFLTGRIATVEAVLYDVDHRSYLAVTLADDPSADLQRAHGRFYYFTPDEVEPA